MFKLENCNYLTDLTKHLLHRYHGRIERVKAEYLLSSGINGSFLVRESETCAKQLSISLRWEGRVYHYRIGRDEPTGMYFVSKEARFAHLADLVAHHACERDGLTTQLLYPAPKKFGKPQLYSFRLVVSSRSDGMFF